MVLLIWFKQNIDSLNFAGFAITKIPDYSDASIYKMVQYLHNLSWMNRITILSEGRSSDKL